MPACDSARVTTARRLLVTLVLCACGAVSLAVRSEAAPSCPSQPSDGYSAAVLADSPIAYYRLDEPSGATLCDSSSRHHNGTYASGVTHGVAGALPGSPDTAVAATAGIGTGGPGPTGTHSFTLEGWFRHRGVVGDQIVVAAGGLGAGNIAGLGMWAYATGRPGASGARGPSDLFFDSYDSLNYWNTATVGVNLWDGRWHYLAATYDAGRITGYLDGHDLGSQAAPRTIDLHAGAIRLGTWVDTIFNKPLVGDADEIAIYPTALSSAQLAAHYAARSAGRVSAPGRAAPQLAETAAATPVAGSVRVREPGSTSFVSLATARRIRFGATVDATHGRVSITIATPGGGTQTAVFYEGQFRLTQSASGAATLTLNAPLHCAGAAAAAARRTRHLWGQGHGNFTTSGHYAAATVLGTKWLTADTCTGTRITVASGHVRVTDRLRHRSVVVTAPGSYLAGH